METTISTKDISTKEELKYKSFDTPTDILEFVKNQNTDVENIINISVAARGRSLIRHFLWWKEKKMIKK